MPLADAIIAELVREGKSTARILERVPREKFAWKPHAKSMSLGQLAWHIANLPIAALRMLRDGRVEVGQARPPAAPDETQNLVEVFQRNLETRFPGGLNKIVRLYHALKLS